jgi:hypothetical protein
MLASVASWKLQNLDALEGAGISGENYCQTVK